MASSFSVRYDVNLCVLSLVAIHRINTSHENGIITLSPHLEISGFIIMMFIEITTSSWKSSVPSNFNLAGKQLTISITKNSNAICS